MYKTTNDSPKNAIQIYVDGHRYRSLFAAAVDTGLSFCYLAKKIMTYGGSPIVIKNKTIVSEKWILENPPYLIKNVDC